MLPRHNNKIAFGDNLKVRFSQDLLIPIRERHKRWFLKGQVILEMVLVFVSLAVLTAGSMKLFSNLNMNAIERVDKYRRDRLNAVNGWTQSIPEDYLYFSPYSIIVGGGGVGGTFDPLFYDDPRVYEGDLWLEEDNLIENLILPFKFNQMRMLANGLKLQGDHWNHPEYIDYVTTLAPESKLHANDALSKFKGAIDKYQAALDTPLVPGVFDPIPDEHPEKYGLDPSKLDRNDPNYQRNLEALLRQIENLKRQNLASRDRLQKTIDGLTKQIPYLEEFLNDEVIARLDYINSYIGKIDCPWGCSPTHRHRQAVYKINELADFSGPESVPYPKLSAGLVIEIEGVYDITAKDNPTKEEIQAADNTTKTMLEDNEVKSTPMLSDTITRLYRYLEYALKYWDKPEEKDYYLDYSRITSWALYEITDINRMMGG